MKYILSFFLFCLIFQNIIAENLIRKMQLAKFALNLKSMAKAKKQKLVGAQETQIIDDGKYVENKKLSKTFPLSQAIIQLQAINLKVEMPLLKMPLLHRINQLENLKKLVKKMQKSKFPISLDSKNQHLEKKMLILMPFYCSLEN